MFRQHDENGGRVVSCQPTQKYSIASLCTRNGTAFNQVVKSPTAGNIDYLTERVGFRKSIVYHAGGYTCWYSHQNLVYLSKHHDRRLRFGPNTVMKCFNFAYVSPPLPISFCNQSERPEDLRMSRRVCGAWFRGAYRVQYTRPLRAR